MEEKIKDVSISASEDHHNSSQPGKELTLFPNKPLFLCICKTTHLKTLREKEKLLITSNFSFSHCFLLIWRTLCHFHQIKNCHRQTLSV